jgi:dihydropteroate synthase
MGIVNVTPDSFSDGGLFLDVNAAVRYALDLINDGADVVDIGGESTRPGAAPVPLHEELKRVIPVIQGLAAKSDVLISIDTTKAEVARQALAAGALIVNDISGLRFDGQMPAVCSEYEAGIVCMHIRGTPQTMQNDPHYQNVVNDICDYFHQRLENLADCGIRPERVVLDPGVGFGKKPEHNLEILSAVTRFRDLGRPVLIGHSRKRFLTQILNCNVDERLSGTIGVAVALAAQQTDIIRVHDVRAVRDALIAWKTVAGGMATHRPENHADG